jgi:hypothetical protein
VLTEALVCCHVIIRRLLVPPQELEEQLSDEVDQHQRELAALQDVHSQKLVTLQAQHRAQLNAIQEQKSSG